MITIPKNAIHIEDAEITVYKVGAAAKRMALLKETRTKHPELVALVEEHIAEGGDDKATLVISYLLPDDLQLSADLDLWLDELPALKEEAFGHCRGDVDDEDVEFSFKVRPEVALGFLIERGHVPANSILLTSQIAGCDLTREEGYDPPE